MLHICTFIILRNIPSKIVKAAQGAASLTKTYVAVSIPESPVRPYRCSTSVTPDRHLLIILSPELCLFIIKTTTDDASQPFICYAQVLSFWSPLTKSDGLYQRLPDFLMVAYPSLPPSSRVHIFSDLSAQTSS